MVFNLILFNGSGFMFFIREEAIDLLNRIIEDARKRGNRHKDQDYFMTVVAFCADKTKTIIDGPDIDYSREIMDVMPKMYAETPLYDAIGDALSELRNKVCDTDKVYVTIISGSQDNASERYTKVSIAALIESLKAKGWRFTHIGDFCDAEIESRSINIKNSLSFYVTYEYTRFFGVKSGAVIGRISSYLKYLWDKFYLLFLYDPYLIDD